MLEQLKSLGKETVIYGASSIIGKFLNFLLVPFYVNVLATTAEYGIMTSLYVYLGLLNVIVPLGLEAAYFRYASKGDQEQRSLEEDQKFFSTPFLVILGFGSLLAAIIMALAPSLVGIIFSDGKTDLAPFNDTLIAILRYGAIILLLDALAVLPFASLRLERKAKRFAAIRFLNIALTLALNFILILTFDWGVKGIFLANLIASGVVLLFLSPVIRKYLVFSVDREVLRRFLPFGLTNVPSYLASMLVQVVSRPIVQAILGLGMLGVYQANYRMGVAMMVLVGLFEYAWRPFFLRQAKTDDARARQLFAKILTYFMLMALMAFLFFAFYMPYIVSTPIFGRTLLRADYLTGLHIIPIILAAYVFQGMYTNFLAGIYIKERNRTLPFITGAGAAVNVIANLLLIPQLGITAAAIATLLAYATMALLIYRESHSVYPIPYEWPRILLLFAIVGGLFAIEQVVSYNGLIESKWLLFAFRNGIIVMALVLLWISGFFQAREREFVMSVVSRFILTRGKKLGATESRDPLQVADEKTKVV